MGYILILDDSESRHAEVERVLGERHIILHSFDVYEAQAILRCGHVRILAFLVDHDLGTGLDGDDCALWLMNELDEEKLPASAVVISNNAYGADNIASKLKARSIPTRCIPYSSAMVKQLAKELEPE